MKPLHELAAALVTLSHGGWTQGCNPVDLAEQVREFETRQAEVAEEQRAAEEAMDACVPDGTVDTCERWLRVSRRLTSTRQHVARLSEVEVFLRAEVERQVWLARHRQARAETQRAAA